MFRCIILCLFVLHVFLTAFSQNNIDYSDLNNWATIPGKDPAHLNKFIKDSTWIKKADVFYIYPTFLVDKKDTIWNISLPDSNHLKTVVKKGIKFQASAWAESGRMFAPLYRQAHIRSYHHLENGGKKALLKAYNDVREAFKFYLKEYNNGRPIIFASHSQGATHVTLLLQEFFDGKDLTDQLITAYIPGIGIDSSTFSSLPMLTKANDINGYVTWNTFKKKLSDKYEMWYKGKKAINPVTWNTSKTASRNLHKGFYYVNSKMYKNAFTTHLIDGGIWITKPKVPFRSLSAALKDYHIGDVNLFWEDIKQNSKARLKTWFKVHKNHLNKNQNKSNPK